MGNKHKYRPAIQSHKDLTTVERILVHISDDPERPTIRLTEVEKKKLTRALHAYKLLANNNTMYETAKKMMQAFNYGRASAYKDIKDAKLIFNDLEKATKEQERQILLARITRGAKVAFEKGNMDAYAKFLGLEAKVRGMDRHDPELPNFDDLEPLEISVGYYPETMGIIPNPEAAAEKFISEKLSNNVDEAQIITDEHSQENTPE